MFDFSTITQWVDELLRSFLPHAAATLVEFILIGLCLLVGYAVIALVLIYVERKVCAFFQCRIGPNRVGPYGTIQSVADMIKMLTKEIIDINHVDRFLFNLAPFVVIIASVLAFGCIPFAKGLHVIDFNVGIFFLIAVSSIGIVGILLAGWASNNKYSLIGAMRSGAQMISYELSIGLSILTVVVFTGSMQLSTIVEGQADGWLADSELTAGYHTEYSGMHFGFFYLAEYLNMFVVASVASTLFLGGWMPLHVPGWESFNQIMDYIPSIFWFFGKTAVVIFIIMWFKWTFPRLRIDQLLRLEWRYLLPINLINLFLMVIIVVFKLHF